MTPGPKTILSLLAPSVSNKYIHWTTGPILIIRHATAGAFMGCGYFDVKGATKHNEIMMVADKSTSLDLQFWPPPFIPSVSPNGLACCGELGVFGQKPGWSAPR